MNSVVLGSRPSVCIGVHIVHKCFSYTNLSTLLTTRHFDMLLVIDWLKDAQEVTEQKKNNKIHWVVFKKSVPKDNKIDKSRF